MTTQTTTQTATGERGITLVEVRRHVDLPGRRVDLDLDVNLGVLEGAKADDTRRRRIAKSVEMLREGRAR